MAGAVLMILQAVKGIVSRATGGGGGGASLLTDLVAWWDYEDETDSHSTYDWTEVGTPVYVTGKVGDGVESTAFVHSMKIATPSGLAGSDRDFTIAGWVYPKGTDGWAMLMINSSNAYAASGESWSIGFHNTTEKMRMGMSNGSGYEQALSDTFGELTLNNWYFFVGYHDGANSELGISINAGAFDTTSLTGTINAGSAMPVTMFKQDNYNQNDLRGIADSIGFWDRLLTQDEINWLYNSGSGRAYSDL